MNPAYPYDTNEAIRHLRRVEPAMSPVIDAQGEFTMRYEPLDDVFHALLRSIVYQQLTGKAAGTIFGRVEALFPGVPRAKDLVAITDEQLRGAGMSGAKTRAARSLADFVQSGQCPSIARIAEQSNDEVRDALTVVKGIGVWTVDMLLIFRLGRPDVMPSKDLGVRKGYARMHGLDALPLPKELEALTRAWSPWRSVGSWYMWRALDIQLPEG